MHEIKQESPSQDFVKCWQAAGLHIQNQSQDSIKIWIKADLNPPLLEHLSFRLGNQLFFIRLFDVDGNLEISGNLKGLQRIADGCKGFACGMPMRKKYDQWMPTESGWGLVNLKTDKVINPLDFVSDELIEMTDWELHDFAVQVVRNKLEQDGKKITGWNSDPEIQPSIWFKNGDELEWVVVKFSRYPNDKPNIPSNMATIATSVMKMSNAGKGFFASLSIVNGEDPFDPSAKESNNFLPLYRGYALMTSTVELIPYKK